MRTFEFDDGKSRKFWNIDLQGQRFTVTYGRLGTQGQTQTKEFADATKAQAEHDKLVKEKLGKGYVETTAGAATSAPTAKAMENALAADPDDLAAHAAYVDILTEQGDPRGEFIQVQLALEDPARPAKERQQLQKREQELLQAHERAWLGDLAPYLLDQKGVDDYSVRHQEGFRHQWARGWLESLIVPPITVESARVMARAPQARLLRRLIIHGTAYEEGDDLPEEVEFPQLFPLLKSPNLHNLRVFHLGEPVEDDIEPEFRCYTEGDVAVDLVKKMPRLEELYLLAHHVDTDSLFKLKTLTYLRVLQIYHMNHYPLEVLARNAALSNLTHLLLHPHAYDLDVDAPYITAQGMRALSRSPHLTHLTHLQLRLTDIGDPGCEEFVRSGILKRLKVLDLRHGCITDEGARILAASPDQRHLERLDLSRNQLTDEGIQVLKATGVTVRAEAQQTEQERRDEPEMYLYDGDIE
jgi:uncharacterized protein (TIGR02996 family)